MVSRGEMGSLLADGEQFMLIEHIAGIQLEQIQKSMESMMNNGVNIKKHKGCQNTTG